MPSASRPPLTERILSRLAAAEWRESNPHLQDDYRIAWITVLHASRGWPIPHVTATYAVLGMHPEKVWPAILARRRFLLGSGYERFFARPWPPKKPSSSVRDPTWIRRAA